MHDSELANRPDRTNSLCFQSQQPMNRHILTTAVTLVAAFAFPPALRAQDELPGTGTAERPALLLEAENQATTGKTESLFVFPGTVSAHEGDESITVQGNKVVSNHKGIGKWSTTFLYDLSGGGLQPAEYTFWARYMCGGEPQVSNQIAIIEAGPDAEHLEERAKIELKHEAAWKMAWNGGKQTVDFKATDVVIKVHVEGQAHDAKVFDGFLLVPVKP
jgi:hypothetical protein